MMENGKGIQLFFKDGNYSSLMKVTGSSWRGGIIYVVPRAEIGRMLELEEAKGFGVYVLLSESRIYAGEASDLRNRIKQHDKSRNWWERAVLITTTDDSLDQADINYLETSIISIAKKQKRLKCENKQVGNRIKIDEMKKAGLDSFLYEALAIMKVLGILNLDSGNLINDRKTVIERLEYGNGAKNLAMRYLIEKGFVFKEGYKYNYSARQQENENTVYHDECWINPAPDRLESDWYLILNDTMRRVLHVFSIPHGTFHVKTNLDNGFRQRSDNGKLDMFVNLSTFTERKSGISLRDYLEATYEY